MIRSSSNGAPLEELQLGRTGQNRSSPVSLLQQHWTKNSLFTSTAGGEGSLALAGTFLLPAGRAEPSRQTDLGQMSVVLEHQQHIIGFGRRCCARGE